MKRLLKWITGVAIFLAGIHLLSIAINHYSEISLCWIVGDALFGLYMSYKGGDIIFDAIK